MVSLRSTLPIGVFDSGIGGLTVLSEMVKALPQESFVYLGDTARVPYGNRSAHIVQKYSFEDIEFLLEKKVKMIVIACNTATAHAEKAIRIQYNHLPIVGMIQPGVDSLLKQTNSKRVGVVATNSTIYSGEYEKRILEKKKGMEVFSQACPLLVPLIEEGWIEKEATRLTIQEYFSKLTNKKVSTIILGCTHYPLLKLPIQMEFPNLHLIDSSEETAKIVKKVLVTEGLIQKNDEIKNTQSSIRLYFTDFAKDQTGIPLEKKINSFLTNIPLSRLSIEEAKL